MAQTKTKDICDFRLTRVRKRPFAHMLKDDFLDGEMYDSLKASFPSCPESTGPTGFSLYWGDPAYDRLIEEHPAWKAFFATVHSQRFVDYCLQQFAETFIEEGCLIDLEQARFASYREDRVDKELRHLRQVELEPHELWCRLDIHEGRLGYQRAVHLDHTRRLVSMLIYFCDQQENEMEGGELLLHHQRHQPRRWQLWRKPTVVPPRHNRMAAFPCSRQSLHSVPEITAQERPRKFVQIVVSSSVDAWKR